MNLKKSLNKLVDQELDVYSLFAQQDPYAMDRVCRAMCSLDRDLLAYENFWPIRDMIRSSLRYARRKIAHGQEFE
ncbi:hypothetical protein AURDEDRAFT_172528 [Auricularia subglabra TFB-10046 SS5]|nr:hypothetical protein AURDEDRAFT_172528 [Auricularia subglabra TFB-10046 SS5]